MKRWEQTDSDGTSWETVIAEQGICGATWPEDPGLVCTRPSGHRGGHSYHDGLPQMTIPASRDRAIQAAKHAIYDDASITLDAVQQHTVEKIVDAVLKAAQEEAA
jgi:hypothetical protein